MRERENEKNKLCFFLFAQHAKKKPKSNTYIYINTYKYISVFLLVLMSQIARIEPTRVTHELIFKPIGTYLLRYSTTNDEIVSRIALHEQTPVNPYVVLSVRVDENIYHCPIMHYYLPMNDRDLPNDFLPELIEQCLIESEDTDWKIDFDRFQTGYTHVFSSTDDSSKTQIKCDDQQTLDIFRKPFHDNHRELSILQNLSYFHIITFYGLSSDMNSLIFANHGESLKFEYPQMKCSNVIMSQQLATVAYQIACGMMYLEAKGIIHRDLHAGNILIDKYHFIRIAHFEHAVRIDNEHEEESQPPKFHSRCLAPECLPSINENKELSSIQIDQFSSKSDVWAYGLILIELTIDRDESLYPYLPISDDDVEEMTQLIDHIKIDRQIHTKPDDCPENIYDIVKHCWKFDRNERISFKDLRNDMLNLLKSLE